MKKCNVKTKTIIAVILSLICLHLSPLRADDSDIFGANILPNVMLLIDNSRSMEGVISSVAYDPLVTYTGSSDPTIVYTCKVDKDKVKDCKRYVSTTAEVQEAKAVDALNATGFWSGKLGGSKFNLFVGNYVNYLNCATCSGTESKIDVAKRVAANIVANVQGIRFGVMKFRANGGEMVAPIGTDTATMVAAINLLDAPGGAGTPLGDQLYDAGQYYKGLLTGFSSPIQLECQPNYVIMISDGLHTRFIRDVRDEATLRFTEDHSSLTGIQNVTVHTVGFALDPADPETILANAVLQTTADNGGGNFYNASNSAQLEQSLQAAIQRVISAVFTFANPLVPTTSATGSTRAYIASVESDATKPFWRGYLKAFARDTDGTLRLNPDGTPDATYLDWEAGQVLTQKAAANRTIYFHSVPNAIDPQPRARDVFTTLKVRRGLVGAATNAERDDIVHFIRGVDVLDEDADGNITEDRAWKLGDIFHSTPVLVSPPLLPLSDPSYVAFREAQASRTAVLIVGANDGMLHAFRESDGEELWAWVPEHVFGNLKLLVAPSGEHPYFVDGSPVAADIKVDGTWKTIVMFGLRRGGRHYYALDITEDPATDSSYPKLLWSFTDSKMGETWSEPVIGKIKWTDGSDKYVAFIGGGYDTGENNVFGKAFFVIDLATGAKLAEYYNDGITTDDRQYMNFSIAANPTAVDLDSDGYIDRVYIGDVAGQLWKFEPTIDTTITSTPISFTYEFVDKDSIIRQLDFTKKFSPGISRITVHMVGTHPKINNSPAECAVDCYGYHSSGQPLDQGNSDLIGYVGGLNSTIYGSSTLLQSLTLISENGGPTTSDFTLAGKRLFVADPLQANPPEVWEYFPDQAIYSAPSVSLDSTGNLWTYFGTGDRNHPLNTSSNRFYGIKDNTSMTNGSALTESDLLQITSTTTSVSDTIQGWYMTLASGEKVLAAADVFNNIAFFSTFTPNDTALCGSGGGIAKLYAVQTVSGMAAIDFTTGDALTSTSGAVLRSTIIGTGIPSKPAVMVDPNGNPSVITGTTSQQISSVPAPLIAMRQLLGWREVF